MPTTTTTLSNGVDVRIEYATDDDYIDDVNVYSAETGQDLACWLDYSEQLRNQAWSAAERHMLAQPITRHARRVIAASTAAMCADTPFALGAA